MIRYGRLFLLFLIFSQCNPDHTDLVLNCDPADYSIEEFTLCDSTETYDTADFCGYINHGVDFLLPGTREHSRYMCDLVQTVIFENEAGQELEFRKKANAAQHATQWSEPSPDTEGKSILHCAAQEESIVILLNDSLAMEFRVMLNINRRDTMNRKNDRDQLLITMPKIAEFGKYYALILSYYIKRGNIYEPFNPRFRHEQEILLDGKMYTDVTYLIPPAESDQMEIYFSKEFGIIGFRDTNGKLWTFKRFG